MEKELVSIVCVRINEIVPIEIDIRSIDTILEFGFEDVIQNQITYRVSITVSCICPGYI